MNYNDDMRHVKSATDLARELTETERWPRGLYGDAVGGTSFSDEQSEILLKTQAKFRPTMVALGASGWRDVWAGPGTTKWTVIDVSPETQAEIDNLREALASTASDSE